jgi:ribosomal-protein-alanine N-acetyltransferase
MVGRIASLDRLNHAPDPISEDELRQTLENLQASIIAAVTEHGELVGYAILQVVLDEGYLTNLTVKERYRRQGVGQDLLNVFLRFGQVNLSFLTLTVRESSHGAVRFFEKQGFSTVGSRRNFFEQPEEDGLLMTLKFGKA